MWNKTVFRENHISLWQIPYQTIYSKHNICSYEFLLRFHDSFAGQLRNQIRTTWSWKIEKYFIFSLILHNTTEIIIIIKWDVLLAEKIFLVTSSTGQESPIGGMQTIPKMRCRLQISSYRIDLMSVNGPISPKQCYYEMDYLFYSFYSLDSLEIWLDHNSTYYRSLSKNSDVKHLISHCDSQNLQYKTHPEFWPSQRRIFKTSLYYKTRLILETRRYIWKESIKNCRFFFQGQSQKMSKICKKSKFSDSEKKHNTRHTL